MAKMTTKRLEDLLAVARSTPEGVDPKQAEDAVFKALLDATVYAHVPAQTPPKGRMRFIQFVRPDNGQTVLPFFSDRLQAEQPASKTVAIVAMSGRQLFELTRGATLMLNPNLDAQALYPPEIAALLEGREIGFFSKHELAQGVTVLAGPSSVPTDELHAMLRRLFERESTVRAAYLVEVHLQDDHAEIFLLLTIVAAKAFHERLLQLCTLALKEESPSLALPLSVGFSSPDEPLPDVCHKGVQLYGT